MGLDFYATSLVYMFGGAVLIWFAVKFVRSASSSSALSLLNNVPGIHRDRSAKPHKRISGETMHSFLHFGDRFSQSNALFFIILLAGILLVTVGFIDLLFRFIFGTGVIEHFLVTVPSYE
jgi:hypothetical protein